MDSLKKNKKNVNQVYPASLFIGVKDKKETKIWNMPIAISFYLVEMFCKIDWNSYIGIERMNILGLTIILE